MNWKECVRLGENHKLWGRFEWPSKSGSFDCQEAFTISDVTGAVSWIWTYPGDWLLRTDTLSTFFEYTREQPAVGALGSTLLGWFVFLVFLSLLLD